MTWRVGLTGGIGSGKTAVSNHFAELGVPVIDTDLIAREIVEPGQPALNLITAEFGSDILTSNGSLDRDKLRNKVFSDPRMRKKLESITHPTIRERMYVLVNEVTAPYCIIVVPLLFESNFREFMNRILVVVAPRAKRLEWIQKRSGLTSDEIGAIIDSQASDTDRLKMADDVLENNADLETLRQSTGRMHELYLKLANQD
jgi:dephospho-CoA kinase